MTLEGLSISLATKRAANFSREAPPVVIIVVVVVHLGRNVGRAPQEAN